MVDTSCYRLTLDGNWVWVETGYVVWPRSWWRKLLDRMASACYR